MDFDGFSECWFEDRAAFELAMGSPEWLRMNEDAEQLFDLGYIVPAMSAVVVYPADPAVRATLPSVVAPSRNVTLPAGVPAAELTVAVNVTL